MMTIQQLCRHIAHLVHAPIGVYSEAGERINFYVDHGEQQDLFACDPVFLKVLLRKGNLEYPILYIEDQKAVYGIACGGGDAYILGPCALGQDAVTTAKYLIQKHQLNPRLPYRVYGTSIGYFSEMLIMLFEMLTGRTVGESDLFFHSFCDQDFQRSLDEKVHDVFYELHEAGAIHNPYSQELREQEAIRTGDLIALQESFRETYVGKVGTLAADQLRHEKNMAIVLVALGCRSAIAGGVLPEVAYSMSDAFIQRVEELQDIGKVTALARQSEVEYCKAVRNLTAARGRNPLVGQCKELVFQRLHTKITVQELADSLGIGADYLSRIFIREEGMKLTDYIIREKIEAAKKQLRYTDTGYEVIAHSLGFSTQSHFGQAFKKWVGMTPGQYQKTYGKRT